VLKANELEAQAAWAEGHHRQVEHRVQNLHAEDNVGGRGMVTGPGL